MKKWQKLTAGIAALVILLTSLNACSEKEEVEVKELYSIVNEYADATLVDDIIALDKGQPDFIENVNKLENYIDIIYELNRLDIEPEEETNEDIIEKFSDLTLDDVKELIEIHKAGEASDVEKLRLKAGLAYINKEYRSWVQTYGLEISEELLKKVIKSAACQVSGLDPEDYNDYKISEKAPYDLFTPVAKVTLNEAENGEVLVYEIKDSSDIYKDAVLKLYSIQNTSGEDYISAINNCNEALRIAKIAIVSGVTIEDGVIKPAKKEEDAKLLILLKNDSSTNKTGQEE